MLWAGAGTRPIQLVSPEKFNQQPESSMVIDSKEHFYCHDLKEFCGVAGGGDELWVLGRLLLEWL